MPVSLMGGDRGLVDEVVVLEVRLRLGELVELIEHQVRDVGEQLHTGIGVEGVQHAVVGTDEQHPVFEVRIGGVGVVALEQR